MDPVLPLNLFDFDQPQIRLVDKRRGLQRVTLSLVAHVTPGDPA